MPKQPQAAPKGIKRASPGDDTEKPSPLDDVELSDEDAKKLQDIQREIARTEIILERAAQQKLLPVYEKRRQIVAGIDRFWPVALMNHSLVAYHVQHQADQNALSYLEDVWVARDPKEPRCYTIEFTFKENPYFTDKVLKKEYKYVPPPAAADEKPDEDGVTDSMLDFSWERDVQTSGQKINWKDADKSLTKQYPREVDDDDNEVGDPGSFFNFFELEGDSADLGLAIAGDVFTEAIDYFTGNTGGGDEISSDEDEEDDDDEAEEIDLEKPRTKKAKV